MSLRTLLLPIYKGRALPPPRGMRASSTHCCGYRARCTAKRDLSSFRAGPAGAFSRPTGLQHLQGRTPLSLWARPFGEAGSSLHEPAGLGSPPVWPVNNIPNDPRAAPSMGLHKRSA